MLSESPFYSGNPLDSIALFPLLLRLQLVLVCSLSLSLYSETNGQCRHRILFQLLPTVELKAKAGGNREKAGNVSDVTNACFA